MNLILQFAMILAMILHLDGKSVRGIVGDRVQFPVNCPMNGTAELYLEDGTENPPRVAARRDGVCTPGDGFTDRLDLNSCFSFSRSLYTDSGLYESRCGGGGRDHIQLDVVVASESSVSEGEPVTIRCYYKTAGGGQVETLRWEKSGVMVLEVNLSTKEITNGTGFEGKRLSAAGATEGDFSLTWAQAQVQDEGDYFCSVRSQGVRRAWGDPAAARLKVIKKDLDPTTPCPPQNRTCGGRMETWITVSITAAVTSALWALCWFLVWWLKFRRPNVSPGPDGGRQLRDVKMGLLTNGNSAGPQTNGSSKV
ncbi:uncharacterized protein LOC119027017 [Acanthopagrus latus]|uniref:uncharacterized protein LOC119027017 n=1 Tax=Acanthopagrus latus TaxID=8177 RepID=UPI00187C6864|nr:uncharacterized protein LOC119027017 [Acanthopagrus latus]